MSAYQARHLRKCAYAEKVTDVLAYALAGTAYVAVKAWRWITKLRNGKALVILLLVLLSVWMLSGAAGRRFCLEITFK